MLGSRKQFKFTFLVLMIAGLSMGNESCEQAQTGRVLKMEVEVGSLRARSVRLPNGETVDFPYVVNSLFYRQVMANSHFVISNPIPTIDSMGPASIAGLSSKASEPGALSSTVSNVDPADVDALNKYGFINRLRSQAASRAEGEINAPGSARATQSDSSLPACLYDLPMAQLGGEVVSFEANWGVGVGVGYGRNGSPIPAGPAASVEFNSSKLEMGFRTVDPLRGTTTVATEGIANQSKIKLGIDFSLGLPIGLDFFFNTPIADVIKKAMDRGLDAVVAEYIKHLSEKNSWDDVWESRVIYDPEIVNGDTHIAFRGGSFGGMKIGDRFAIKNLHYKWEGAACYTRLKYTIPLTTTPIAIAEVVTLGNNIAVAKVEYLIDQKIKPGAQVKLLQFKPEEKDPKGATQAAN